MYGQEQMQVPTLSNQKYASPTEEEEAPMVKKKKKMNKD
jgi:hypothetical protein